MLGRKAGEQVEVTVSRNQQAVNVNLVLASAPKRSRIEADKTWTVLGLRLEPVPAGKFEQFKTQYHGGLLVTAVKANSPAAQQGIRAGDVLVGMHIWETVSLENVEYILDRTDVATLDPVKFYILRDDGDFYGTYYGHISVASRR